MPVQGNYCNVEGCYNRSTKDGDTVRHYYRLPAIVTHQGADTQELSTERRRLWLAKLDQDFSGKNLKNIRVCSDHFVNKKKASLYNQTSPDWIPTINMKTAERSKPDIKSPEMNERYKRAFIRQEKAKSAVVLRDLNQDFGEDNREGDTEEMETGLATQTEIDQPLYIAMSDELQTLRTENIDLKAQVLSMSNAFKIDEFRDNDAKVKYFTGLPKFCILLALFNFVQPKLPKKQILDKFQLLMLCLVRMRLNLPEQFLAYTFHISISSVSRYIIETIDILYRRLKRLIYWPEREQLRLTMPMQFRKHFGKKIAVIIDCFEIFVEKPSNREAQCKLWSNYKHHHTAKYLIGIIPQGSISFISKGWVGRTSDKYITEHSGFLSHIINGDVVMADRGFDISESLGCVGATSQIPAFTKRRDQLSPLDLESTRKLANVRIHVERVIGVVRQKYITLASILPVDYLHKKKEEQCVLLDKVVTVACCLVNMCPSVVECN